VEIAAHYLRARNTSNLKSELRTTMSAADVLTATGWMAQNHEAAILLWDVAFRGKTGSKHALIELLAEKLTGHMLSAKEQGSPRRIAQEVLAWHLHNTCKTCGGVGHEIVPETITRSDDLCSHCYGTGKEYQLPEIEAYRWLAAHIAKLQHHAGGEAMRRLNDRMEL
jgi:hypothetical protein